ncbi:hypothetical protein CRUP_003495 [Coryphaenoides rupestris]|nr:hypothetical protein CRUP_003495 [Coryphaenoides rupestris]
MLDKDIRGTAGSHKGPLDKLKAGEEEEAEEERLLASDIEGHIHALHRANELKYKACVRSKVANLRNPKSGHLRRGLLDRSLLPRDFACMTTEEMAGPDLRQQRREYAAQAVNEHQLPRPPEGTPTQKVRCRRCGASDCRVSQMSRGALFLPGWVKSVGPDHDAVTFVTCSVCGEQWYHSGWVSSQITPSTPVQSGSNLSPGRFHPSPVPRLVWSGSIPVQSGSTLVQSSSTPVQSGSTLGPVWFHPSPIQFYLNPAQWG